MKFVTVDSIPALDAGDEVVAMVVDSAGAVTVVTRHGAIHMRAAGGGWTAGTVDNTLPTKTHDANPPAQTGSSN